MNTLIDHAKEVASTAWMNSFATRGEFAPLKRDTAIVYPAVIPANVAADLVTRIDRIADTEKHPRVWRDAVGSDTRIFGFEQDMPDAMSYFDVMRYIKAVDDYVGLKTHAWFLMANRVLPKPGNKGSGGGLHRDSPFSHQVKCLWYLSDVTTETGPFQYVPGTHFNAYKTRKSYPLGQTRFDTIEDELVEVHAKAGSLLVCDTKCIHGGKPIQSGARYVVTLYTFTRPASADKLLETSGVDPTLLNLI